MAGMTMRVQSAMSLGHLARVTEVMALSYSAFHKRYRSSYESPSSSSSLALPVRKRYRGTSEGERSNDEGHGLDDKGHGLGDEDHRLDDDGHSLEGEGLGLEEEEEAANKGQQQVVPVEDTATSKPLGIGYGAARLRSLESIEEIAPHTYEVGQSFRSMPEQHGADRVSAFRHPTLNTWEDPEDDRVYIDILVYPPVASVQTLLSPKWSSGSLPVSPSSPIGPSPIASLVATLTGTISVDIDRDVRELYTRSGVRLMLALEAWAGHVDTRLADTSWDRYNDHRLIHDMLVQQAAMQRELQEIRGRIAALEHERGRKEP
ncbi:hypothetical protein Tco_0576797 [Tanacetum coccineum]